MVMLRWESLVPAELCRAFKKNPYKLLILLVLVDVVFIFSHLINAGTDLLQDRTYTIGWEYGYAELYLHIKEFWIAVLLLMLAVRTRTTLMFVWSLIFFYVLLDDVLKIHENMGSYLQLYLSFDNFLGLLAKNLGQQLWSFIVGVPILIILGVLYTKSTRRMKSISISLFALLVLLAFFGVFLDTVHSIFRRTELEGIILLIEEAGEMIVMSIITWYVFYLDPGTESLTQKV